MSSPKNLEYKKTSFLNKANSAFIEEMYLKYINKDINLANKLDLKFGKTELQKLFISLTES